MMTGFTLLCGSGGGGGLGLAKYSPEFPRGGDAASLQAEILDVIGAPTGLTIGFESKNRADTAWTPLASFGGSPAPGVLVGDATGILELCRFSYYVTASNPWEGVYMLVSAPSWRPS